MFIKNNIPSQDYGYQIDVLPVAVDITKVDEVPTEMPSSPTLAVGKVDARDPAERREVKARNDPSFGLLTTQRRASKGGLFISQLGIVLFGLNRRAFWGDGWGWPNDAPT